MTSERGGDGRTFTETARRAQIVAAAVDTIAEVGFAKMSLARIAERIGVSKGVISYHFAGKDELVREIIVDVAVRGEAFIRGRALAEESAPERLRAFLESNLEFIDTHRKELLAFVEIAVNSRGNPVVGQVVSAVLEGGAAVIRDLLAAGQASGEFRRDFDPLVMATAIRAAVDAVPPRLAVDPSFDVGAYARELADLFVIASRSASAERE